MSNIRMYRKNPGLYVEAVLNDIDQMVNTHTLAGKVNRTIGENHRTGKKKTTAIIAGSNIKDKGKLGIDIAYNDKSLVQRKLHKKGLIIVSPNAMKESQSKSYKNAYNKKRNIMSAIAAQEDVSISKTISAINKYL